MSYYEYVNYIVGIIYKTDNIVLMGDIVMSSDNITTTKPLDIKPIDLGIYLSTYGQINISRLDSAITLPKETIMYGDFLSYNRNKLINEILK